MPRGRTAGNAIRGAAPGLPKLRDGSASAVRATIASNEATMVRCMVSECLCRGWVPRVVGYSVDIGCPAEERKEKKR